MSKKIILHRISHGPMRAEIHEAGTGGGQPGPVHNIPQCSACGWKGADHSTREAAKAEEATHTVCVREDPTLRLPWKAGQTTKPDTYTASWQEDPPGLVRWHEHNTRGYLDGGPACDECGACDCATADCLCGSGDDKVCQVEHDEECDYYTGENESGCIGLSFGYSSLDGGDFLCEDCVDVVDCDCPEKGRPAGHPCVKCGNVVRPYDCERGKCQDCQESATV